MPIISSYIVNNEVEPSDIVIGTDVSKNQTKNFNIASLSNAMINLYLEKISWKFVVVDPDPEPTEEGTIFFNGYGGAGTDWSTMTYIDIMTDMPAANNALPYLERLVGQVIIFQDRKDIARFGVFRLTALTQVSGSVYRMALTFIQGNLLLTALQYYSITMDMNSIEDDKNYVHTQGVPSAQWTVNHNLNKFPSVSVVNNNNILLYGEVLYTDLNNLTINFSAGFSGKAYLN